VGDTEKIIEGMDVGKADGKREAMIVGSWEGNHDGVIRPEQSLVSEKVIAMESRPADVWASPMEKAWERKKAQSKAIATADLWASPMEDSWDH
jgi:hypothetical protein